MNYVKQLNTKYSVDVFVAGGGPSGVAAAVTAARQGKSVYLAESHGSFGGSGTTGLVPTFVNFCDGRNFLAGGIGREIHDQLTLERDHSLRHVRIKVEQLKRVYDEMVLKAGVKFSFFTNLCDVIATDGHIDHVVLSAKSGLFAVKAKIYIDCTGDGDLCEWAGGMTVHGNEDGLAMPATLCSLWNNIDFSRVNGSDDARIEEAIRDGVFSVEDRHLPGMYPVNADKGVGGGNIGHCFALDARDEESITEAMLRGRRYMQEYEKYYKEYLSGYEDMNLVYTADMIGIRESRRVMGDYILNYEDYCNRASFEDEIGRYRYAVDIHIMKPDRSSYDEFHKDISMTHEMYQPGESYGIPYRSLIPVELSNALVAGRCISVDRKVQSSVRVMPCCFITGQATGVAAALACESEDTRGVNVRELQYKLKEMGGYLPNYR